MRAFSGSGFSALVLLTSLGLAACSSGGDNANPSAATEGTNLRTVEVSQQGKRYVVQFFARGGGAQQVSVRSASFRPLGRSDGQAALYAAAEAGDQIDCGNGAPVRVDPASASFRDVDNAGPGILGGQASWLFLGQCGG